MAFLDNNIITLDAVLTDIGRKRLAQGNGSFVVSQFALGDDEINYGLFDANNSNGTAYYDLNILQTPVFEAITNSSTALKYNLLSYNDNPRTLFLPVMKLNTILSGKAQYNGAYVVIANQAAYTTLVGTTGGASLTRYTGFTDGRGVTLDNPTGSPTIIMQVDQGIDNAAALGGPSAVLSTDLTETQISLYMNNLFLEPISPSTGVTATASPTTVAATTNVSTVTQAGIFNTVDNTTIYNLTNTVKRDFFTSAPSDVNSSPVVGPKGPSVQLALKASSTLLNNLSYYFNKYGSSSTSFAGITGLDVKVINTSIKVKGMTLGYELSIPIQVIAQF
jgi:hypothetical protein